MTHPHRAADHRGREIVAPVREAEPVSARDWADADLTNIIYDIHAVSRRSYGAPRVWAELRLGQRRLRCSRKRVERLMAQAHIVGIYRRPGPWLHRARPGRGAVAGPGRPPVRR